MAVECSVCMENFGKKGKRCPKLLPCSHTVCLQCLRRLAKAEKKEYIHCPECRHRHQIPRRNVANYATNRYLLDFMEMEENHEELTRKIARLEGERKVQYKAAQTIAQLKFDKIEFEDRINHLQVQLKAESEKRTNAETEKEQKRKRKRKLKDISSLRKEEKIFAFASFILITLALLTSDLGLVLVVLFICLGIIEANFT